MLLYDNFIEAVWKKQLAPSSCEQQVGFFGMDGLF